LTAIATDNNGVATVSSSVNFTVNDLPGVYVSSPANGAQYTFPSTISLAANATDGDGYITKVDFYDNGSLVGSNSVSNSVQYHLNYAYPAPGVHSITAVATDNAGATKTSAPVNFTVNSATGNGTALFVVNSTTLTTIDSNIKTRLENFGLTVTIKTASAAVSGDATGKRVVVISESVTPADFHSHKKHLLPDVNENLEFRLMNNCG
jgi:hypothetical protein